jgi:hypothetical protein
MSLSLSHSVAYPLMGVSLALGVILPVLLCSYVYRYIPFGHPDRLDGDFVVIVVCVLPLTLGIGGIGGFSTSLGYALFIPLWFVLYAGAQYATMLVLRRKT